MKKEADRSDGPINQGTPRTLPRPSEAMKDKEWILFFEPPEGAQPS